MPYKEGPGVADIVGHSRAVVGRKRDIADGASDWQPVAHGREQEPFNVIPANVSDTLGRRYLTPKQ